MNINIILPALAVFMWITAIILELDYLRGDRYMLRFQVAQGITMLGTVGVFLSTELFPMFICFEIMSFASVVMVAHNRGAKVTQATISYLGYAVAGGMASLMALILISAGYRDNWVYILLIFGFSAKAGMFPFHTWLPRAHAAAPSPSSALLSGIITKTGIYGIILSIGLFEQNEFIGKLLIVLGIITMVLGGFRGIISLNLKQVFACSSISQLGFIITGLGCVAMHGIHHHPAFMVGVVVYIINHALCKLVIFGTTSYIFTGIHHEYNINKARGAGRPYPLLMVAFIVASLAISGIPLLSGYIGKTLIHEALMESMPVFEPLFILTGGMTGCYMIKSVHALFIAKGRRNVRALKVNKLFYITLLLSGLVLFCVGLFAGRLFEGIEEVHFFSWHALSGAVYSVALAIIFFVILYRFGRKDGDYIDITDKFPDLEMDFYRPLLRGIAFVTCLAARLIYALPMGIVVGVRNLLFYNRPSEFTPELNENFGNYNRDVRLHTLPRGISYSLLLFALGLVGALCYLVISV